MESEVGRGRDAKVARRIETNDESVPEEMEGQGEKRE